MPRRSATRSSTTSTSSSTPGACTAEPTTVIDLTGEPPRRRARRRAATPAPARHCVERQPGRRHGLAGRLRGSMDVSLSTIVLSRCRWSSRSRCTRRRTATSPSISATRRPGCWGASRSNPAEAHRSGRHDRSSRAAAPREARRSRLHLRVGEAGAGELRQPAQSEARHALGRRGGARREFRDGARVGAAAQGCCARRRARERLACWRWPEAGIQINLMLMALNLLPILPLDGGRIAGEPAAAARWRAASRGIEPYGFVIVIVLSLTRRSRAAACGPLLARCRVRA